MEEQKKQGGKKPGQKFKSLLREKFLKIHKENAK